MWRGRRGIDIGPLEAPRRAAGEYFHCPKLLPLNHWRTRNSFTSVTFFSHFIDDSSLLVLLENKNMVTFYTANRNFESTRALH
jgi:hypothetical protein